MVKKMNKNVWIFSLIMMSLLLGSTQARADKYISVWAGVSNPDSSDLGSSSGLGLLVGYQFNEYFALEGGKRGLGGFDDSNNAEVKVSGYEIAAVAMFPLNDTFSAYARVGGYDWSAKVDGTALDIKDDDDGVDAIFSAGFSLTAVDQGAVKLEYSQYTIADIKVNYVGMGFEVHF